MPRKDNDEYVIYMRKYRKRRKEAFTAFKRLYKVFNSHAAQIAPLLSPKELEAVKFAQSVYKEVKK